MDISREWTQRDYQKSWLTGNLKEGKKTRPSPKDLERWDMYSHECKRSKNGWMERPKAMEYGSRIASPDVLKPHIHTFLFFIPDDGPCSGNMLSVWKYETAIKNVVIDGLCDALFLEEGWITLWSSQYLMISRKEGGGCCWQIRGGGWEQSDKED